ncbi:hypothetical protein GGF32_002289 [Allomyces javanicus]|nr:hypothetical protein GGF32_002289 [Allomyces javanicus]
MSWFSRSNAFLAAMMKAEADRWASDDDESAYGDDDDDDDDDERCAPSDDSDKDPVENSDDEDAEERDPSHSDQLILPSGSLLVLGDLLAQSAEAHAAPYTFGGLMPVVPGLPGLVIDDVGTVSLPVVEGAQVAKIMAVGRDAPFGRGFVTLVDPAVRKTCEIDPAKVHFTNPAWDAKIAELTTEVATKLGFPKINMTMHLHRMLLYGPDGHFLKHRDTEEHDRMFATVVVQLPSVHEGGELVVYQDPTKPSSSVTSAMIHDFGRALGTNATATHYAVHYADAEHELRPVTKGYRIALVYSLCWPSEQPVPKRSGLLTDRIAHQLLLMFRVGHEICYYFDHHYTTGRRGGNSAAACSRAPVLVLVHHALQLQLPAAAVQVLEAFPDVIAALGCVPRLMQSPQWQSVSVTVLSILGRIPVGPRVELCVAIVEKLLKDEQRAGHDSNACAATIAWDPLVQIAVNALLTPPFSTLSNRAILTSKVLQLATKASAPDLLQYMVASPVFVNLLGRQGGWFQLSAIIKSPWCRNVEPVVLQQLMRLPWPTRFDCCIPACRSAKGNNIDEMRWLRMLHVALTDLDLNSPEIRKLEFVFRKDVLLCLDTALDLLDLAVQNATDSDKPTWALTHAGNPTPFIQAFEEAERMLDVGKYGVTIAIEPAQAPIPGPYMLQLTKTKGRVPQTA